MRAAPRSTADIEGPADGGGLPASIAKAKDWLRVRDFDELAFRRGSNFKNFVRWCAVLVDSARDNSVPRRASSLTYTTILSLFPMFVLLIATASFFFTAERQDLLINYIQEKLYPSETTVTWVPGAAQASDAGENISAIRTFISDRANTFRQSAAGIGVMGFVAMLVAAGLMFAAIEDALDSTWSRGGRRSMKRTFMTFTTLLVLGPVVLAASLAVSTVAIATSEKAEAAADYESVPGFIGPLSPPEVKKEGLLARFQDSAVGTAATAYQSVLPLVPITINILFICGAYMFIPQAPVKFRYALLGAIVSGLLWEASKMGFASYVFSSKLRREIFFSLGAVPIFLVWIYITWIVFLLGNEIAFTTQNYRRLAYELFFRRSHTTLDGKLFLAAMIMVQRHFDACKGPLRQRAIAFGLNLAPSESDELVERLLAEGFLVRGERPVGLAPARPADKVDLAEVMALGCDARGLASEGSAFPDGSASPLIAVQEKLAKALEGSTLKGLLEGREEIAPAEDTRQESPT